MVKGFVTIADLQFYWKNWEDIYLKSPSYDHYQKLMEPLSKLYSYMLEYQIRAICHLSKKQLTRAWAKVSGQDDWAKKETELVEASKNCKDNIIPFEKSEVQDRFNTEMQKLDQIANVAADISNTIKDENRKKKEEKFLERLSLGAGEYFKGMDYNKSPVSGTCEWFYNDESLSGWLTSSKGGVFWITAGPGCGKSVLARSLITQRHLASTTTAFDLGPAVTITNNETTVCYFFFKDDTKERSSINTAMCALLHQLLTQGSAERLLQESLPMFSNHGAMLAQNFDDLWSILIRCGQVATGGDIVCVLDALDECSRKDRERFVCKLDQLYGNDDSASSTSLKFLITSRPYDDIERSFLPLSKRIDYYRFDADDRHEQISHDVNLVIDEEVKRFSTQFGEDDCQKIAEKLKSQGTKTYLWLRLTLEIIEGDPSEYSRRRDIELLLSSIPPEASDAYEKILSRNKGAKERKANLLLQIVLAAQRPLTLDEANYALTLADAEGTIKSHAELEEQCWQRDFKTTVKNLCGLIISVYDNELSFIHLTAKEFLTKRPESGVSPTSWEGRFADASSWHAVLGNCCIEYLLLSDFLSRTLPSYEGESEVYKFLDYSAHNWPGHFKAMDSVGSLKHLPQVRQLCDTSLPPIKTWVARYERALGLRGPGLCSFQGWTDLAVASFVGILPIVELLIAQGADINELCLGYGSAFKSAVAAKQETIATLLISNGAEVEEDRIDGGTALDIAVTLRQDIGLIKLLLQHGACPLKLSKYMTYNYRFYDSTILAIAASFTQKDIFYVLLDGIADTSTPENIISLAKNDRIVTSGHECVALVFNLLEDDQFQAIITEDILPTLFSVPSIAQRALKVLQKNKQEHLLVEVSILDDGTAIDGFDSILQQLFQERERPWERISGEVLTIIAEAYEPSTLRLFLDHSPADCDIKALLYPAHLNDKYANEMCDLILNFAKEEIVSDERFQEKLLRKLWCYMGEAAVISALLSLPRHSIRIKRALLQSSLPYCKHKSVIGAGRDSLVGLVLHRIGYAGIVDKEILELAANICDRPTLELLFQYSSNICLADEVFLKEVATNSLYGTDILDFLLNEYQPKAIITPAVAIRAARHPHNFQFLLETRPHEVEISVELLIEVDDEHLLQTLVEKRGDEVALVASRVLQNVTALKDGSYLKFSNWLTCCPLSWFEPTEELILDMFEYNYRDAAKFLALLINKLGQKIRITERILAAAASCSISRYGVLETIKTWRPQDFHITPRVCEMAAANGEQALGVLNDEHYIGTMQIEDWLFRLAKFRSLICLLRSSEDLEQLKKFWDEEPVVDLPDAYGRSALHIAAKVSIAEGILFLLDVTHADVHAVDRHGFTPLHIAVRDQSFVPILILIAYGADPNAASSDGETPISLAKNERYMRYARTNIGVLLLILQDPWFASFWMLGLEFTDEALRDEDEDSDEASDEDEDSDEAMSDEDED